MAKKCNKSLWEIQLQFLFSFPFLHQQYQFLFCEVRHNSHSKSFYAIPCCRILSVEDRRQYCLGKYILHDINCISEVFCSSVDHSIHTFIVYDKHRWTKQIKILHVILNCVLYIFLLACYLYAFHLYRHHMFLLLYVFWFLCTLIYKYIHNIHFFNR